MIDARLVYKLGLILGAASSLTLLYFWAFGSTAPGAGPSIQIVVGTGVVGYVLIYLGVKSMMAERVTE